MCLLLKSTAPRLLKSLVISLSVARSPLAQSLFLHSPRHVQSQQPFWTELGFYSDAVAGAREALICGVSSLYMSLNWKKDVSYESDMKDAVGVSLPLIYAVVKSIQEGVCPKSCLLNIEIPSSPWTNKVLSSIALWLFIAAKAPKDKHPYGHS